MDNVPDNKPRFPGHGVEKDKNVDSSRSGNGSKSESGTKRKRGNETMEEKSDDDFRTIDVGDDVLIIDVDDSGNDGDVQIIGEKNDYVYVSSGSDTDSWGYCRDSFNADKVKMEKEGYVGIFHVGSDETVGEGKGSVMMVDEYDATEMTGFVPLDRWYDKMKEFHDDDHESDVRETTLNPKKRKRKEKNRKSKVTDKSCVREKEVFDSSVESENLSYENVEKSKGKSSVGNIENAINLLMASILQEGGEFGFDEVLMQTKLPLKFRFEDEDPAPPPEKEPWEKEIDDLFAEMDMCLTEIYNAEADADVSSSSSKETEESLRAKSPIERCRLGYHMEVLEEPIGIICKCCQLVLTEMKYIFPALITPSSKKRNSSYLGRDHLSQSEHDHNNIPLDSLLSEKNYISSIRTDGSSVLDLIPFTTRKSMYKHQLDGFEFLWKNVVGETSIEKLKESQDKQGCGCIISHAPGTGKTFLTIVFIMTLLRAYPECRPLIVAPKCMLLTWQSEFEKWGFGIPFHNLNSDDLSGREIEVLGLERAASGSGHGLDNVVSRRLKLCSWKQRKSVMVASYDLYKQMANGPDSAEKRFLLEMPGLLVLDEGHTPRNEKSRIWKAFKEVKTRRRIILSGTPFQNSFKELKATLHLVNPDLISNSDLNLKNLKSDDISKLKAMVDPLVHVYKGTILQEQLPGLKDAVVVLRPSDEQKRAFEAMCDGLDHFDKDHLVSLVSVHPSLAAGKREFFKPGSCLGFLDDPSPDFGVKTRFVMELVRRCDKEKVLIFCEYLDPLNFLKEKFKEKLGWIEGAEILYMDGKQGAKTRQSSIRALNDPNSKVRVFLASTKACSEGIHLVGASRVVLLDVSWNPSVEKQAISRAFRLGEIPIYQIQIK